MWGIFEAYIDFREYINGFVKFEKEKPANGPILSPLP
jgi:hypothetical protein